MGGPSRTPSTLGITNADVVNIAYGDGFYTQPDPRDHRVVYANSQSGRTYLVDFDTREEGDPARPAGPEGDVPLQLEHADAPVSATPTSSFMAGTSCSGPPTVATSGRPSARPVPQPGGKKLPGFFARGGERNEDTPSRDDGVSDFGTITTISESPVKAGVLYVGTDDGNVQMSPDAGKSWQNLTSKFPPGARWVSRVLASRHGAGTAYVTFDGHQDDDFKPHIFRTTNGGDSWSSITGDLPDGVVINTIEEHPRRPDLLLAGTEFGLYFTLDGGRHWTLAAGNLPRVPIDDIVISERDNDVVLGTHGRSIIILDDITPLERASQDILTSDVHLFPPRPAVQHEMRMLPTPGASEFSGPNPAHGALITYYPRGSSATASRAEADDERQQRIGLGRASAASTATDRQDHDCCARRSVVRELKGRIEKASGRVDSVIRSASRSRKTTRAGSAAAGPLVMPWRLYGEDVRTRGKELTERVEVKPIRA